MPVSVDKDREVSQTPGQGQAARVCARGRAPRGYMGQNTRLDEHEAKKHRQSHQDKGETE